MSDANTNRWWESFHVIEMADILLDRNDKQLDTTLGFFLRELNLSSGDRVFDQCCGVGSVSIPLAEKGLIVEGCDLFAPYICLLYTSPSPRDRTRSRMPSSA